MPRKKITEEEALAELDAAVAEVAHAELAYLRALQRRDERIRTALDAGVRGEGIVTEVCRRAGLTREFVRRTAARMARRVDRIAALESEVSDLAVAS